MFWYFFFLTLIVKLCMDIMAGPKGQPYVYDTYGWPEGPALIPRDSCLGRRPSLLIFDIRFVQDSFDGLKA